MKIQWSPLSIDRISEISDYIAQDSPMAAERWVHAIFDRVEQVKDFSKSGQPVPEINRKDLRQLVIANYRIIYRIESTIISILTVRHCRQILPDEDIDNAGDGGKP
ncbi:type II toxin-antitoxin system RelE/ParE family toxin [Pontiella desulfatans]|uniref:type II toxin-antitoxin system RelE/ParE family toxin n=1 Tax=Pontiella desulfatans TaxID=2750659 RepID=UPI00109C4AF9|nr:type II toxin-antitoxin system RelE/ParE family toxin [Pontiella desulfatans]